jgi:hypothetical protein
VYGLKDPGFRNPAGARDFSFLLDVQKGPGSQPAAYSAVTHDLSLRRIHQGVKLTAHLHSVSRLRMSGAIHLFPYIRLHGVHRGKVNFTFYNSLLYCSNSCTSLHFKILKSHTKALKIRSYMFWSPLKPSSGGPWPYFAGLLN